MAQVTYNPMWITERFFEFSNPCTATILNVSIELNARKQEDIVLELVSQHAHVRMSVWGDNLKTLIDACGKETDAWIGRKVQISSKLQGNATRRFISVL